MLRQLGQAVKVLLAVVTGEDGLVVQVLVPLVLVSVLAAACLTVLGVSWNIWTKTAQHTSFQTVSWGDGDGDADVPTANPLALIPGS